MCFRASGERESLSFGACLRVTLLLFDQRVHFNMHPNIGSTSSLKSLETICIRVPQGTTPLCTSSCLHSGSLRQGTGGWRWPDSNSKLRSRHCSWGRCFCGANSHEHPRLPEASRLSQTVGLGVIHKNITGGVLPSFAVTW